MRSMYWNWTYYLTYKAKSIGYYPKVVLAGREINDNVSNWIVEQLVINLAKNKIPIGATDILILGFSLKKIAMILEILCY